MKDQLVVVLCNLKAKKLGGFPSHGMVMCAETPDRLTAELLRPPAGSEPGDLISFEGYERLPPKELPKKNPYDNVEPKLKINAEGVACYEDIPFRTPKGIVTSD
jgi:tRNA-binding EMAP/Myf-like protein